MAANRTKVALQFDILLNLAAGSALINQPVLYEMAGFKLRMRGGTIDDLGGPVIAETDGPGGPLVVGDHIFRDSPVSCYSCL